MRIPPDKLEEIRSSADILGIVSDYVSLKKKGQNYFGLCPFHPEKTPSFSVNPQKQIFHCFGCSEGGNVFSFIMKIENLSFVEAAQFLANKLNIPLPQSKEDDSKEKEKLALYDVTRFAADFFKKRLWEDAGTEARNYLTKRGYTEETIRQFELGYAPGGWDHLIKAAIQFGFKMEQLKAVGLVIPNNRGGHYDRFRERIIFPVHNLSGFIVGFGGRNLRDQPEVPKYINSPETAVYQKSRILYGLFQNKESIRKQETALLVEGYADVLGLMQAGIKNVVASSGTSLTREQARVLLRYAPNTVILYDGDLAGAYAALRGVDILLQEGLQVRVVLLPEDTDPDSFVKQKGGETLLKLIKEARDLIDFKIYAYTSEKPLKTPQQKATLVHQLAESVGSIQDEVIRNLYIQDIAKKLNVSETAVFRAVAKTNRFKKLTDQHQPIIESNPRSARFHAEQSLIEIILRFSQMLPIVYQNLEVLEFQDKAHCHVLSQIYDQYVQTGSVDAQHVLDFVEDRELQNFIANTLMKEEQEMSDSSLRRWTSDCIKTIKMDNLQKKIDEVREAIKNNEEKKNFEKVREYNKTWTKLKMKKTELKMKDFVPV